MTMKLSTRLLAACCLIALIVSAAATNTGVQAAVSQATAAPTMAGTTAAGSYVVGYVLVGPNLGNVMVRMEYMKMVGGCAAALATQKNSIGFVGPLINDETRRLTVSAYLGARYCFQKYRNLDPNNLKFEVKWIGFWFNIPGQTLDP